MVQTPGQFLTVTQVGAAAVNVWPFWTKTVADGQKVMKALTIWVM
jgi:hypothetical protein